MKSKYDILIIEDENVVINAAKKILIPEGFTVDETFDVESALKKLERNKYKLILTDLMLPKISGLKLTEIVHKKYSQTPIIMITGYATLENAVQSIKTGAFDFIPKPFAFEELLAVVFRALKYVEMKSSVPLKYNLKKHPHNQQQGENNLEKDYFLGKHSWARLERDGSVKMGVGETFSNISGEIQRIDFPPVNEIINQGNVMVRISTQEQMEHKVWAPLSGTLIQINHEVEQNVNLINIDPFFQGWLVRIMPTNLENELAKLSTR